MGAAGISCLLCPVWHCGCATCERDRKWRGLDSYRDSGLYKLISKPDPVLLEDQSSETSSERHNQTAALFLTFMGVGRVLLDYQLVMNFLLRKVSNRQILKTRPPKDKLFAQISSIEESCKSFKSWPYLNSHVTRIEKNPYT